MGEGRGGERVLLSEVFLRGIIRCILENTVAIIRCILENAVAIT